MDPQTVAMIAAAGAVATAIYLTLGVLGVKSLRDIRDRLDKGNR